MKRTKSYWIIMITFTIILSVIYYYYPRKVKFELIKELDKPSLDFNLEQFIGFNHVQNEEQLRFFMIDYHEKAGIKGYSLSLVENIAGELDFIKYDYIITYHKELKELLHSPHLTETMDDLYFDKRIPLIPTWKNIMTDKVYIYRIKKNKNFRSAGP